MKKLLRFITEYKKQAILAPLFKMLEASFELFVPLVVTLIIDVGIEQKDKSYIGMMCLVMIALGVIGMVCSITAQYYSAKAAVGYGTKLRTAFFSHIQSFSYTQLDKLGISTLITRITSDINQTQTGVNLVLRLFLRSPFIVLGAMVMAFTINVKMAFIFVVTIPLLSIVVFGIMLLSIPLFKKVQMAVDKVLGSTRSNLNGVRVIRAFHEEEEEIEEFNQYNFLLTKLLKFVGKISAFMNPLTYIIINGALVVLLWYGAIKVDVGILTTGQVVALVSYMSQILVELVKLASLIITINKSIACGNRVQAIFEIVPEIAKGTIQEIPKTYTSAVSFQEVSLTYDGGGAETLSNINIEVDKGQVIGIIGATASGKSSFVNLIPNFYQATKGQIKIFGVDIDEFNLQFLREQIGFVPQKTVLFKGTIEENLRMGNPNLTQEQLEKALEVSQAKEFVDKLELGMQSQVEANGKNFSGGQRQRLAIARALAKQPKILILDDSASALDYQTDANLRKAIGQLENAPTLFIVSQRVASLMYADQIVVLEEGVVAGLGTHEQLMETCDVYKEIYEVQFPTNKRA